MRKSSGFTLRRSKKPVEVPSAKEALQAPPPEQTRSVVPSQEELNHSLNKRLTQELKGRLFDAESRLSAYQNGVRDFLLAMDPLVEQLLANDASLPGVASQLIEKLSLLRGLEDTSAGGLSKEENPIQRQARLESLTTAIREQKAVVEYLISSAPPAGPPIIKIDFFLHTPFILTHFVLSTLDRPSLGALASTCRLWHKRVHWFLEMRARTSMLVDFVKRERAYAHELNLGLSTFGRSMEKHGIVDKTVIFLNIPIFKQVSHLLEGELMDRLSHWSPEQLIGDVFVRLGSAFDLYLFFAARLDSSLKLVKSLLNRAEAKKLINDISVRMGRDLHSFLTAPVSHCAEMCAFLQRMASLCPPDHPDVPHLQRALEQMRAIMDELDKKHTVESVLASIIDLPARLKESGVSVLREGPVTLDGKSGRLFLCSGCIIFALEDKVGEQGLQYTFSNVLDFKPSPPVVLSNVKSALAFDLQTSQGSTVVVVKNVEERISWMQSIKTAIDAFLRKSSTLNVFAMRKDVSSLSQSSRSISLQVSKRSQVSLHGSGRTDLKSSKKMITLGRSGKNSFKGLRGLQKRPPLVDLAPGHALYQVFVTRLVRLDIHPASLSADGAFLLITPTKIMCYCGPKVAPDAAIFSSCLTLGSLLATAAAPLSIVDHADDSSWWAVFGLPKLKLTDNTPKEYIERYQGSFFVTVIHSDMRISEEGPNALPELRMRPCHFVLDVRDDVYVWVGAAAPFKNKTVAMAKADEVFEQDVALRPHCASIIVVEEGGPPNLVFETLLKLAASRKEDLLAQVPPLKKISSAESLGSLSRTDKQRGATVAVTNSQSISAMISPRSGGAGPLLPLEVPISEKGSEVKHKDVSPRRQAFQENKVKLDSALSMLDSAEVADQTEISYSSDSENSANVEEESGITSVPAIAPKSNDIATEEARERQLSAALAWIYDDERRQDDDDDPSSVIAVVGTSDSVVEEEDALVILANAMK